MNLSINQWDMAEAAQLHNVWCEATAHAPYAYAVDPETFATGIIPVESDDESCATAQSQKLIVASYGTTPLGFAHLCADDNTIVNDDHIPCGIIRFLAFSPQQREVGQALLTHTEQIFQAEGFKHADAFPLFHGYPFHNHKIGILSSRMTHVSNLLTKNGYKAHDKHLTLELSLDSVTFPDPDPDIDIIVEKTNGAGTRPNIRVKGTVQGETIGTCRSQSGCTYANHPSLETLGYTRWLGVKEDYRRKGIGRYLLKRACYEMRCEGYERTVLNCRGKNQPALSLYKSEGYTIGDTSFAYVKNLDT